jgi:hypothetical protein
MPVRADGIGTARRPAARVQRLNELSARRFRRADDLAAGRLGDGPVIPVDLLSVAPLGLDLDESRHAVLAREEVASIIHAGLEFEAVLTTGFGFTMATMPPAEMSGGENEYALVQIGEETRHSQVFISLLRQLRPQAENPFATPFFRWMRGRFVTWMVRRPLLFQTLVLGGEEVPDLVQRLVAEHPGTDPHLAAVASYHRAEEARHMTFARLSFTEYHRSATFVDRLAVRWLTPVILAYLWDTLIHPGVYAAAGLPPWRTWGRVRAHPDRVELRRRATVPVRDALVEAGAIDAVRPPRPWRWLCESPEARKQGARR